METVLSASDKQSMVSSFLEIAVGQSSETARQFLQATSWKLEEAIQLFYVGNEAGAMASSSHSPPIENANVLPDDFSGALKNNPGNEDVGHGDMDEVRAPLPVIREALYDDAVLYRAPRMGYPPHEASSMVAFRNFDEETKRPGVWEMDQGAASSMDNSRDNLASLYRPPFALMYHGSFEKAKVAASVEDKWLLVNVQSANEFSSHTLNRDTWANEAVAQTVGSNFIFWQVYEDTSEGRKVCTYYKLESIPVILVVDPITGQKMRSWCGMVQPERLLEDLLPFMDDGPKNHHVSLSHKRPRETSNTPSQQIKESLQAADDSNDDDEEVQLALAASMENMKDPSRINSQDQGGTSKAETEETSLTKIPSYPPLPEEPKGDRSLLCRVGIRLPDGRRLQRNFYRTDPIQLLWSFCHSQLGEARAFRLTHAIPGASKCLEYESSATFEESGIANSMISVTWE